MSYPRLPSSLWCKRTNASKGCIPPSKGFCTRATAQPKRSCSLPTFYKYGVNPPSHTSQRQIMRAIQGYQIFRKRRQLKSYSMFEKKRETAPLKQNLRFHVYACYNVTTTTFSCKNVTKPPFTIKRVSDLRFLVRCQQTYVLLL